MKRQHRANDLFDVGQIAAFFVLAKTCDDTRHLINSRECFFVIVFSISDKMNSLNLLIVSHFKYGAFQL